MKTERDRTPLAKPTLCILCCLQVSISVSIYIYIYICGAAFIYVRQGKTSRVGIFVVKPAF